MALKYSEPNKAIRAAIREIESMNARNAAKEAFRKMDPEGYYAHYHGFSTSAKKPIKKAKGGAVSPKRFKDGGAVSRGMGAAMRGGKFTGVR